MMCFYLFLKSYTFLAIHGCLLLLLVLLSEILNFGPLTAIEILLYFTSIFATLFVLSLLGQLSKSKALSALMTVPFSLAIGLVTSLFIVYPLNFSEAITADVLFAVLQTNPKEAIEFLGTFINSNWHLAVLATIILIFYLAIKQSKLCQANNHRPQEFHIKNPTWTHSRRKGHVVLSLLLGIVLAGGSLLMVPKLPLVHFINTHVKQYLSELSTFRAHQKKRAIQIANHSAYKQTSGETYMVIIPPIWYVPITFSSPRALEALI